MMIWRSRPGSPQSASGASPAMSTMGSMPFAALCS